MMKNALFVYLWADGVDVRSWIENNSVSFYKCSNVSHSYADNVFATALCHRQSATNAIRPFARSPFGIRMHPCELWTSMRSCVAFFPHYDASLNCLRVLTKAPSAYVSVGPFIRAPTGFLLCNKLWMCVDRTDAAEFQSFVHFLFAISMWCAMCIQWWHRQPIATKTHARSLHSIVNHSFHPSSWSCTHSQTHTHFIRQFRKTVLRILVVMTWASLCVCAVTTN